MTSVNAGQVVQPPTATGLAADARMERSKPHVRRFAMLIIPLALLLVTFKVYRLEQPEFFLLACMVFGGFAVCYKLPFRFKETFLILLSLAGAYVLLSPAVASLLIAVGLALFGIVRSRLEFRWRVLALLAVLAFASLAGPLAITVLYRELLAGLRRDVHVPYDRLSLRREVSVRACSPKGLP